MNDLSALHDMALFVEVARTGSFSRASARLGVPGATVSRRIASMERAHGVRLFNRTTRHVELTDAGRRYFERCAHLVDEARLAHEALRESAVLPTGRVRVSMPVDLGVFVIGPLLPDFARQYPGVGLDLDLSPRHTDLVGEQVDLAIRLGEVTAEHLVVRRLGAVSMALFASPEYLALRGTPQQPAALADHDCIAVRHPQRPTSWSLERGGESVQVTVQGRISVNNQGLMRLLAEQGLGIAALAPALMREAASQGRLAPVLPEWSVPSLPIQAVMASRLQPACVKVLVEVLAVRLAML